MNESIDQQLTKFFNDVKNCSTDYDDFFNFFETVDPLPMQEISNPLPMQETVDPLQSSAYTSPVQSSASPLAETSNPLQSSASPMPETFNPLPAKQQTSDDFLCLEPTSPLEQPRTLREMETLLFGEPLTPLQNASTSLHPFDEPLDFSPDSFTSSPSPKSPLDSPTTSPIPKSPLDSPVNYSPESSLGKDYSPKSPTVDLNSKSSLGKDYSPKSPTVDLNAKSSLGSPQTVDWNPFKKKCLSPTRIGRGLSPSKDPLSKLLPDPRIKRHSPIRAPIVQLKRPAFSLKRKKFQPKKFYLPPQKRFHRHKITHVLAVREGEYVLTDGHKTLMRRDGREWSRLLESDLQSMKLFISQLFCADKTSYALLVREKKKWVENHPVHRMNTKYLMPKTNLEPCQMCKNDECLKHLAIKGGIQRFVSYTIDVPTH